MQSFSETRGFGPQVRDVHAWAHEQASGLRQGDVHRIDCEALAECLEALAANDLAEARELARRVLVAVALFEFRPARGGPSRRRCLAEAVSALTALSGVVTPSFAARLEAEFDGLWRSAAARAATVLSDLGIDPSCVPQEPPFGWADVFGEGDALPF